MLETGIGSFTAADLSIPGIPEDGRMAPGTLRLAAYAGEVDGVVATVRALRRKILIDSNEFWRLRRTEQLQVLRHEAAHVALVQFFGHGVIPAWLNEGFAEWAAPDPTCHDRLRLRLEFLRRARTGLRWPAVADASTRLSGQLHRDYLASFFRYVDRRTPEVIATGDLLREVRDRGLASGFREATGVEMSVLEAEWVEELEDAATDPSTGTGTCDVP